jgi:hypothetical protein
MVASTIPANGDVNPYRVGRVTQKQKFPGSEYEEGIMTGRMIAKFYPDTHTHLA